MGLILVFLAIAVIAVIVGVTYWDRKNHGRYSDSGAAVTGITVLISCVFGFVLLMILAVSYSTYVEIRTSYDATLQQYKQAVTVYADHANIDVQKAALTDFKYAGYQNNMADFVRDLRKNIVRYNYKLISKRVVNKNWFFGALIIAPDDDMKVLNLIE